MELQKKSIAVSDPNLQESPAGRVKWVTHCGWCWWFLVSRHDTTTKLGKHGDRDRDRDRENTF